MEYVSVAEARKMSGLRLALSAGTPGPWGIAARALFDIRKVPYVPVLQVMMAPNEELVEWTGRRNAPVAIYNDEPAQDGWLEIAVMAERLGSGPSLFPDDPIERALATGFSAEICGHGGFAWSRRLTMTAGAAANAMPEEMRGARDAMMRQYGSDNADVAAAMRRAVGVLDGLSEQIRRQHAAGSPFLVGKRLSICDIHWAAFSQLVCRLSDEDCPLSPEMRAVYSQIPEQIVAATDPLLIEHRDRILRDHIGLPLDF